MTRRPPRKKVLTNWLRHGIIKPSKGKGGYTPKKERMTKMTFHDLWMKMTEYGIATDNEIDLVTDINGCSIDTLNDIIYARTGYRDFESYEESELDENDDDEPRDIDSDMGFDPYMGDFTFDC